MNRNFSKEKLIKESNSQRTLQSSKYKLNIPKHYCSSKIFLHNCTQDITISKSFKDFLLQPQNSRLTMKVKQDKKEELNQISINKFNYLIKKTKQNSPYNCKQLSAIKYKPYNYKTYRHQKSVLNNSTEETLALVRKQSKQNNLSIRNLNQNQFCYISIVQNQGKRSYNYKVSNASKLFNFLKSSAKNSVGFICTPKNIQLDIFISLQNQKCDLSFLNGNSLTLSPLYKQLAPRITINNFQILKQIGSGGFSKVFLCRFKQNRQFYAMKMIQKKFIIKHSKSKIVMNERNIMKKLCHPFIIQMKFAFQSNDHLIFIVQYCSGGELFNLIKRYRRISEKMAKIYMVQILLALQYMHKQGVIYRDFKPQNILLDIEGHVKIADFGLAKQNYYSLEDRSFSFCGSPQYMPPQMILKEGHSLPVDFYCLGAVLYQLVTGLPPFYSKDTNEIYNSTINQKISFPQKLKLSNQIKNLLASLLQKNQSYRLGSMYDVKQVLAHPWFGKINKQQYLNKQITPPVNFLKIQQLSIHSDQFMDSVFLEQAKIQQKSSKTEFKKIMTQFFFDFRQKQQEQHSEQQNKINIYKKLRRSHKKQQQKNKTLKSKLTQRSLDQLKYQSEDQPKVLQQSIIQSEHLKRFKNNFKLKKHCKKKLCYRINTNESHSQVQKQNYLTNFA